MANPAIATAILSDQAVLTAQNEVSTLPASNLQTRQLARKWRTSGLANIVLEGDLGTTADVNFIGLFGTNASQGATIEFRLADSPLNLDAAPLHDSGFVPHWPEADLSDWAETNAIHWIDPAVNARWFRIKVQDAANPAGYYQAGRVYVADAFQASKGFQFPLPVQFVDPSTLVETPSGQEFADEAALRREITLNLRFLSEADVFGAIFDLQRQLGSTGDLFVMADPTHPTRLHRLSIYGRFANLRPVVWSSLKVYEAALTVREFV